MSLVDGGDALPSSRLGQGTHIRSSAIFLGISRTTVGAVMSVWLISMTQCAVEWP